MGQWAFRVNLVGKENSDKLFSIHQPSIQYSIMYLAEVSSHAHNMQNNKLVNTLCIYCDI